MENIKNFVNSITGSQKETHQNQTSFSGNSTNRFEHFIKMENIRTRTESESSNASVSSISSNGSQKEKDNYFWVMYVPSTLAMKFEYKNE